MLIWMKIKRRRMNWSRCKPKVSVISGYRLVNAVVMLKVTTLIGIFAIIMYVSVQLFCIFFLFLVV